MNIKNNYKELIGSTPLFHAQNLEKALGLPCTLLLKLDMFNPARSSKDRAAYWMLEQAEKAGLLTADTLIIEPTSGNTGIGLAAATRAKGYRTIIVMPETMTQERRDLIQAYGAELVLTEAEKGTKGAIEKAQELAAAHDKAFMPSQFKNPANALAHYETTGPELWRDTEGRLDYFVAGVGTGGTITGVSRYFKEQGSSLQSIAVEPAASAVLSGSPPGKHSIQGIGAGFVPELLDTSCYTDIVLVQDEDAKRVARLLLKHEGLMVGLSSGAAIAGVVELSQKKELCDKLVCAFLPDSGERYLSTGVYHESL